MREAVELGMVECSRSRAERWGKRWSWAWWSAVGLERRREASVAKTNIICPFMGGQEKTVPYKLSPNRLFTSTLDVLRVAGASEILRVSVFLFTFSVPHNGTTSKLK